jgi:hypothetical protein
MIQKAMTHEDQYEREEELREAPLLASLKGRELFRAPEGYLDRQAERQASLAEDEALLDGAPLLRAAGRHTPFQEPEGYFESHADAWKALDGAPELAEYAPALARAGKGHPFAVPGGYFEALPDRIAAAVRPAEARVRPLWQRPALYAVLSAAAACVLLLWALPRMTADPFERQLAQLSTEELYRALEAEAPDEALLLEVLEEEDLAYVDGEILDAYDELSGSEWLEEIDTEDLEAAVEGLY